MICLFSSRRNRSDSFSHSELTLTIGGLETPSQYYTLLSNTCPALEIYSFKFRPARNAFYTPVFPSHSCSFGRLRVLTIDFSEVHCRGPNVGPHAMKIEQLSSFTMPRLTQLELCVGSRILEQLVKTWRQEDRHGEVLFPHLQSIHIAISELQMSTALEWAMAFAVHVDRLTLELKHTVGCRPSLVSSYRRFTGRFTN